MSLRYIVPAPLLPRARIALRFLETVRRRWWFLYVDDPALD